MSEQHDGPRKPYEESQETRKKSLKRSWASSGPVARLTCVFAGIAALATVAYAFIAAWQLYVMRSSQEAGTQQMWAAIGNINWMAKNADESLKKLAKQVSDTHKLAESTDVEANAAKSGADTARNGLELAQRAYLSVGQPENPLGLFAVLQLPIENYGHVPCKRFTINLDYRRANTRPAMITVPPGHPWSADLDELTIFHKQQSIAGRGVIPPGSAGYSISVDVPPLTNEINSAINAGDETLYISGFLIYDTGFGNTDRVDFCNVYRTQLKKWINCGSGGTQISLTEDTESQRSKKE